MDDLRIESRPATQGGQPPGENPPARSILLGLLAAIALAGAAMLWLHNRSPAAPNASTTQTLRPRSGGELLLVAAGQFTMGQQGGQPDESPHVVSVDSFYMDRNLVTQELYEIIMGANPSKRKGAQKPVERIQWADAVRFCNTCSQLDGLTPCYDPQTWECHFDADGYRVPTEAEWEYACRAGTSAKYFYGDDPAIARQYAWCKPQSEGTAHPVGRKLPNAWGLHDMLGNVWEWCNDWYSDSYYQQGPARNPRGPLTGKQRVLRGGAWDCTAETCTAARRSKEFPFFTDACFGADTYGFRRVRNAATPNISLANPATKPIAAVDSPKNSSAQPVKSAIGTPTSAQATAPASGKLQASQLKGTIVFVSDRTGTLNIWSMHADGSEQKPLTSDTDPHADPRFSPDGKAILYTVLHGGFPEVWQMNRNGSAPRKVTFGSQADFSPDARQIAFIRDNQVWVRDVATSPPSTSSGLTQEHRITPQTWERCGVPAWSPDGHQLAVASRHTGAVNIYLLTPDGKQISPLPTEEESCTPRWSRDGQRLLCQTVKGHVHQVHADGRNWEQETSGADVQHEAQYSPDGSTFVFCRAPSSEGPWQICVSRLGDDGMDFVQLTTEGSNLQPDWYSDAEQ